MNILFNAQPLLESAGGIRTYVAQLLDELKRTRGIDTLLLAMGGRIYACPKDMDAGSHRPSASPRALRQLPMPLKRLGRQVQLRAKVRCLKGYIYHEPNHILQPWPLRRVVTIHDLTCLSLPQYHPSDRVKLFRNRLGKSLAVADAVITVSRAVRDEVIEHFPVDPQRVHAIPLGVVPRAVEPHRQAEILQALNVREPYFLSVGAVEPRKNLDLLARAACLLRASCASVGVVHAGPSGWNGAAERGSVKRLMETGLWRELGVVDGETLSALYARCVSLVFPSHDEGFGLPPLEAMSAGAPAIVSDIRVHREILGNAAALCDPRSPESLGRVMRMMLEDPQFRDTYIVRGRERVKLYTWERAAAETARVYASIEAG